ncbi:hypothetical protein BGZ94_004453, partial [Podila epigama]
MPTSSSSPPGQSPSLVTDDYCLSEKTTSYASAVSASGMNSREQEQWTTLLTVTDQIERQQVSKPPGYIRRTTNPNLKTTKTGKIQHKSKKAGVNRRSTAYNRFLQQRSKYFAKEQPHLTPQQ